MTLRLWPGNPTPSGTSAGAESALTLGTQFSVSAACALVNIWWYSPAGATALPQACGIWDVTSQALVVEDVYPQWLDPNGGVAQPGDGWVRCNFTNAAVTLESGLNYAVSVWQNQAGVPWWVTIAGYWVSGSGQNGLSDGALSAPNNASSADGQGCYSTIGAWAFPGMSPGNGEVFFVDVEVSQIVPAISFTVTATATNTHDDVIMKVYVVTGGMEAGGAFVVNGGYGTPEFMLTPAGNNSVIVTSIYDAGGSIAITPTANNMTDDAGFTSGTGNTWWDGHYSGSVASGNAVTLGGADDNGWNSWTAYEVATAGAASIDASTPAAVHALVSSSVTTATFTPPNGSVLVALLLSNGTATQVFSVSDTSGLGLAWTQRGATYSVGYIGSSAIYTTTVASAAPPQLLAAQLCSPLPSIMTTF